MDWLKAKKLTSESKPVDWINALLSLKNSQGDSSLTVTIEQWTTYSNLKAILMNAGSTFYTGTFKPFTPQEIQHFLGLYLLSGLSPSPQVKFKFLPQSMDDINGNDMCFHVFGPNAEKCHKECKAFFTVQDLRKAVPPRSTTQILKLIPSFAGYKQHQWKPLILENLLALMNK